MRAIATICARGGSKGVPMKNIRSLGGRPLIVHSIEQALALTEIDGVYVSTDSEAIAEVAESAGAKVPFLRPDELATSEAPKVPVIRHLVDHLRSAGTQIDLVVDLDPTSPLRSLADIRACISLADNDTDLVITGYEADKNPYFNMVEMKEGGAIGLVKVPSAPIPGRQSAPKVYAMNASVYVWKPEALMRGLWDNRIKMHVMPRERSVDIDSELDFWIVEKLMEVRNAAH